MANKMDMSRRRFLKMAAMTGTAMCIEPGNTAETSTLKPMEQILKDKFGLSDIRCDTLQQHHSQNTSASTLLAFGRAR